MSVTKHLSLIFIAVFLSIGMVPAEEHEFLEFASGNLYAGGGLSYNTLRTWYGRNYDNAVGVQGFFGWDFLSFQDFTIAGEAGVFYSGVFKHRGRYFKHSRSFYGPYITAVGKYPFGEMFWAQARLGASAISGISSGMAGGGIGFRIIPAVSVRLEAVSYGFDLNSFQAVALVEF